MAHNKYCQSNISGLKLTEYFFKVKIIIPCKKMGELEVFLAKHGGQISAVEPLQVQDTCKYFIVNDILIIIYYYWRRSVWLLDLSDCGHITAIL